MGRFCRPCTWHPDPRRISSDRLLHYSGILGLWTVPNSVASKRKTQLQCHKGRPRAGGRYMYRLQPCRCSTPTDAGVQRSLRPCRWSKLLVCDTRFVASQATHRLSHAGVDDVRIRRCIGDSLESMPFCGVVNRLGAIRMSEDQTPAIAGIGTLNDSPAVVGGRK